MKVREQGGLLGKQDGSPCTQIPLTIWFHGISKSPLLQTLLGNQPRFTEVEVDTAREYY